MSKLIESKKYLASELTRDKLAANRVTLLLGFSTKLFKRMMSNTYYTVTNINEAREFVARFSVPSDQLVIVEDLSLLDSRGQAVFLKFIEESYCPLLLLASEDNLLDTILSRCKRIIKVPVDTKYNGESLSDFIADCDQETLDFKTLESESLLNCPEYFYIYQRYLSDKSSMSVNKYIKLL